MPAGVSRLRSLTPSGAGSAPGHHTSGQQQEGDDGEHRDVGLGGSSEIAADQVGDDVRRGASSGAQQCDRKRLCGGGDDREQEHRPSPI